MIAMKPGISKNEYLSNLNNGIAEWSSEFRRKTFSYLKDKNIQTVVDVGANFGVFTDKCLEELPVITCVDAVEPDNTNFEILQFNLESRPLVQLHHFGIFYGAVSGKVVGIGDNSPGGYMFAEVSVEHHGQWTGGLSEYDNKIFEMRTLESFLTSSPDLIKIDVEGAEYNIIESSSILKECRYVIIEFHNHLGEYVRDYITKQLPGFRVLEFTSDTYGSPYYWYAFLENTWKK